MKDKILKILDDGKKYGYCNDAVACELMKLLTNDGRFYSNSEINILKHECYMDGFEDGELENE